MSKLFTIIIISISVALGVAIFWVFKKIYQKIRELINQNRLLRGLRKLDELVLGSTDLKTVCQGIVNVTRGELGYIFGAIALVDKSSSGIRRIAISHDPKMNVVLKDLPIKYEQQVVPFGITDNFLVKAFLEKKMQYTTDLYDVQKGVFSKEVSRSIQRFLGFKSLYIYPLISTGEVIGILYFSVQAERERIPRFELDIMKDFSDEVSRILDNVLLYQRLKNTSSQLGVANQKLQELDKIKDEFVSITSHELRTPMTAIRSYAWMALHRSDTPLSKTMEKYLVRILMSTERMINLVSDMLNVSRIESGRIEINPESVDLILLVRDIVDEAYQSKAPQKNIQITLIEEKIPQVFADPEKLREVFLNLLGNAVKFTPTGGTITIKFFTDGKTLETSIKDSGIGIAKEDLGRLFTKFGKLESSYVALSSSGGTGLGLYISKNIIELMHGKIWAASEGAGRGAIFTFSLPVASKDVLLHADKYQVKVSGEAKVLEPVAI